MWRKLNEKEVEEFILWAHESFIPGNDINPTWHPVVQEVCCEMNKEHWGEIKKQYVEDNI